MWEEPLNQIRTNFEKETEEKYYMARIKEI